MYGISLMDTTPTPPATPEQPASSVPPVPPAAPAASQSNDKLLAVLCHISYVFLGIIFPLIVYLVKKDESAYIAEHAKEALNYQITVFLAAIACMILIVVGIGIILLPVVSLGGLVFAIIATIKANDGVSYKYPVCLRLIK